MNRSKRITRKYTIVKIAEEGGLYPVLFNTFVTGLVGASVETQNALLETYVTKIKSRGVNYVPTTQVLFDGDSMSTPYAALDDPAYSKYIQDALDSAKFFDFRNFAVPGQTAVQMLADAKTQIDPLKDTSKQRRVLVLWAGINDVAIVGNAAIMKQTLLDYHHDRINAGFMTVAVTMTPAGNPGYSQNWVAYDALRLEINQWIRENKALIGYSALADPALDVNIGAFATSTNLTYFVDGIHFNAAGRQIVASYVTTAIQSLPATNPYPNGINANGTPAAAGVTVPVVNTPAPVVPAGNFVSTAGFIYYNNPLLIRSGNWVVNPSDLYRNGTGMYATQRADKVSVNVKASVIKMYNVDIAAAGLIQMRITRITDSVVVYDQTYNHRASGLDGTSELKLTATLPDNYYKVELINVSDDPIAFDALEIA